MIRALMLSLVVAAPAFAAGPPDPDWPCVQRRQPACRWRRSGLVRCPTTPRWRWRGRPRSRPWRSSSRCAGPRCRRPRSGSLPSPHERDAPALTALVRRHARAYQRGAGPGDGRHHPVPRRVDMLERGDEERGQRRRVVRPAKAAIRASASAIGVRRNAMNPPPPAPRRSASASVASSGGGPAQTCASDRSAGAAGRRASRGRAGRRRRRAPATARPSIRHGSLGSSLRPRQRPLAGSYMKIVPPKKTMMQPTTTAKASGLNCP